MTRLLARLALCAALLMLGVCPGLTRSGGEVRAAAGLKTYASATYRYSIQYPGTWLAAANVPLNPSKPEPKLPKTAVAVTTPGTVTSGNIVGLIGIVATPNRFSSAEVTELEENYLTTGDTLLKPITRTTHMIHGVAFRQAATVAKIGSTMTANVSILSTRRGGFTYFLFLATIRGKKTSTLVAAQSQGIINSIRFH